MEYFFACEMEHIYPLIVEVQLHSLWRIVKGNLWLIIVVNTSRSRQKPSWGPNLSKEGLAMEKWRVCLRISKCLDRHALFC